jgi:ribosomal protein S18 acetylase RimI-like enzyme
MNPVLDRLERYYDAAPRSDARAEQVGPFTLFVKEGAGWPYYARPTLGGSEFTAGDVDAVRARQRELSQPEAFEWVDEVSPSLAPAAAAGGLHVHRHPLMLLQGEVLAPDPPAGAVLEIVAGAAELAWIDAVQRLGFDQRDTLTGPAGLEEVRLAVAEVPDDRIAHQRITLERGLMRLAVARMDGAIVCAGGHKPVGDTSEIVGVATLPVYRRRGLAGAVTAALASDARRNGADAVFLSAGDDDVARLYGRLGFVSVGTACIAEAPE